MFIFTDPCHIKYRKYYIHEKFIQKLRKHQEQGLQVLAFLHGGVASDAHCQQEGPKARSGNSGCRLSCREVLVVGIRNYLLGSCVGLLARGLDLILGELEAERPLVSELEGEGEGDSVQAGPVPGRARVGVCRNRMQMFFGFFFEAFGRYFLLGHFFVCACVWLMTTSPEATRALT